MADTQPRTPPARQREMARDDKGATPRKDEDDAMHGPNRREACGTTREEDLATHEAKVAGMRSSVTSEQDLPVSSRSDEALVEAWQHFHAKGNTTLVPESPEAIEIANIHNELERRGLLAGGSV